MERKGVMPVKQHLQNRLSPMCKGSCRLDSLILLVLFDFIVKTTSETGPKIGLVDVDEDGDVDLISGNGNFIASEANQLWLNDGIGAFSMPQSMGNSTTLSIAIGDFDDDGDPDLATANSSGEGNRVWANGY